MAGRDGGIFARSVALSNGQPILNGVLADDGIDILFDSSSTLQRADVIRRAAAQGKAVYCEKPIATRTEDAISLADAVELAGVKNGVVQDKLWLPGIRKLRMLRDQGFFGRILSVRGEFGYWVFAGHDHDQPAQRPSWNYRCEDGGGIMIDMFCHWEYVIDDLFGRIQRVLAHATTEFAGAKLTNRVIPTHVPRMTRLMPSSFWKMG